MWILVLNDISNPEITRFDLVMTTHYTNSDSPTVGPQVQEEDTHTKEKDKSLSAILRLYSNTAYASSGVNVH